MENSGNKSGNKNREVKPLGVWALVMGCIYAIPVVAMFFAHNGVVTVIGLAAIPIMVISFATAKTNFWKPPATNVKVSYYGHRCFKLECDEKSIFIDPYKAGSVPGLKPVKGTANLVLFPDGDESGAEQIKVKESKKPLPFEITEFEAQDGSSKLYMLDNGDHRIVHLGALNCKLTDEQIEAFRGTDILMVPVGGKYTIDEKYAAELTLDICPEYVIPMSFLAATYGLPDVAYGSEFASIIRNGWLRMEDTGDRKCPVYIRLAARCGKEKGLASVEVRNRDDK